jgi:hypothetical protein
MALAPIDKPGQKSVINLYNFSHILNHIKISLLINFSHILNHIKISLLINISSDM